MDDGMEFYAHTPAPEKPDVWHLLADHLATVKEMAGQFAEPFDAKDIAQWIGQWHDAGKYNERFRDYLKACHEATLSGNKKPHSDSPHAIYGASYALQKNQHLAAFIIACHHAGLQNVATIIDRLKPQAAIKEANGPIDRVIATAESYINPTGPPPVLPTWLLTLPEHDQALASEFLIRMLFSCLVDADWLNTEQHGNATKAELRNTHKPDRDSLWNTLWDVFSKEHDAKTKEAEDTNVNQIRSEVYNDCISAADTKQGIFRLTVPTGGGKTLSSMAFALRHAMKHKLDHIIIAIPYTSIIDQTADIYRKILGDENVLEHHSSVAVADNKNEQQDMNELRRRLLCENWDAPIIVTTTVQLFESIFSNRTSSCRKLHNIANSVLILDEVQTLPPLLLDPLMSGLQELTDHYHITPVLCTATQPALETEGSQKYRLRDVHDIVTEYPRHFQSLKRVNYDNAPDLITWTDLATEIKKYPQVLVVLNTRKDALALISAIGTNENVFHLSTLLCGAHRRDVLAEVKLRLEKDDKCILASTQVIECGVDIDFPVVYRAVAPLDRIVQSAGRCNREGKRSEPGYVCIFKPAEGGAPRGVYRTGIEEAEIILREPDVDLHNPDLFVRYFRTLYGDVNTDERKVQAERAIMNFEEVADKVKLIPDDTVPVVVKYNPEMIDRQIAKVRAMRKVTPDVWRSLQPYTVSLYRWDFQKSVSNGDIEEVAPDLFVWTDFYDKLRGIASENPDPADLICTSKNIIYR